MCPQLAPPLLPVLGPTTMCVFATGHCHYPGTCSWPRAKHMCTTSAGHYHCLPGALLPHLKTMLRTPSALQLLKTPAAFTKDHPAVRTVDCNSLSRRVTVPRDPVHFLSPHLPPTPRHLGSWHTWHSPPPSVAENPSLLKSFRKVCKR